MIKWSLVEYKNVLRLQFSAFFFRCAFLSAYVQFVCVFFTVFRRPARVLLVVYPCSQYYIHCMQNVDKFHQNLVMRLFFVFPLFLLFFERRRRSLLQYLVAEMEKQVFCVAEFSGKIGEGRKGEMKTEEERVHSRGRRSKKRRKVNYGTLRRWRRLFF